jgi:hypothetical protein
MTKSSFAEGEESFGIGQKESSSKVILYNHPSLIYFSVKRDERRGGEASIIHSLR